ncbi:hypothetical protein AB0D10_01020 [Kitasatospora sp. NPDC048545]|uniref:hypothetical protein n=1 Tax=Kitasatospora sp. NPDC048545 TaxID=3157208 RepID=UPI0033C1B958
MAELLTDPRVGLPVPYIVAWSPETPTPPTVVRRHGPQGQYLGYADEHPGDRHWRGFLLPRETLARGRGHAKFASIHTRRQIRCMRDLLCQVCAMPAHEDGERSAVFLFAGTDRPVEGAVIAIPPVCPTCIPTAVSMCPRLRAGFTAVRAQDSRPWGLKGVVHDPLTLDELSGDELVPVAFDQLELCWMVGYRQLNSLHGLTEASVTT